MRLTRTLIALGCILAPAAASAQGPLASGPEQTRSPDRRVAHAVRFEGAAPVIDGVADEAAWLAARPVEGFTQLEPRPGQPGSQRTEARVLYDDDAVYVAMRMHDTAPDSIIAPLMRRDQGGTSDFAHVLLDSYRDRRTAFHFILNPRGVKVDILRYDDTAEDGGWDAVWDGAASMDAEGWTAEFRIPLSQLRFEAAGGAGELVWGVNFARTIGRHDELSLWAPIPADANAVVSLSGDLHGLRGIEPRRRLELQPYSVARLTRAPGSAADPFYDANALGGAFGADLKFGVTSNLTLTATINPDFGQVEADPSVVNLSAYESFFREQRPFFVEGADIFRFGLGLGDGDFGNESLFYSRRIGRAPQGDVDGDYVDAPEATTILGAAKLSGKTAGGWSIGFLDAMTAQEEARYVEGADERAAAVEPLTNYAVARLMRDFRQGQSSVGAIATATNRRLDGERLDFLRSAAYTGGVNARHRFGGGDYEVSAWMLGSHVRGSAEAITRTQESSSRYFQRPDVDHVELDTARTSLTGMAGALELSKMGGGHWRWIAAVNARSPEFEANDLGYMRDADQILQVGYVGYRQYEPGEHLRSWSVNVNQWSGWNFGGDHLGLGGNVNGGFQLHSFWGAHVGIDRETSGLSTSALRGGPMLATPASTSFWGSLYSDSRKPVRFSANVNASREDETDARSYGLSTSVTVRPSDRMELSLSPGMSWNASAAQYVTDEEVDATTHYVFAALDQTTASLTARLNYTFSPTLSLQLYAQPFVSAGRYSGFMEVVAPRAGRFDDRFHAYAGDEIAAYRDADGDPRWRVESDAVGGTPYAFDFGSPDFNLKSVRSNAVLRWEYRPGSTLFVVWSHGRGEEETTGRFRLGRDLGRLFEAEPTNVLLVKASYWLDF